MRVDAREPKAARKHDSKARYRQFVKTAGESKQVWGLFREGWALHKDENGEISFALWDERDAAERCAKGRWREYEAVEIPLQDLVEQLLPQLARDGIGVQLSPTADGGGLSPSIAQLILDFEHETDPSAGAEDL